MYCIKCGRKIENGEKFCKRCGTATGKQINPIKGELKLVQKDEMKAWEEIYNATYAKAYSVAIQIVKNKEDALDILQESYIAAFKNMHTLRDKSKMSAWINQIVANRCKDWLRKKNPMLFSDIHNNEVDTELEFESNIPNQYQEFMPEATVDYNDTKKIMQGILDQLSPDQRLCILMYYYDEMSVGEIARALNCSSGTVKSRLNYARKYIKTQVEALERKGTKLYGIAPIPFIVWMLRSKENTLEVQAAKAPMKSRLQKSMAVAGKKALQGSAKDVAKVTVAKTASAGKKLMIAKIAAGITAATLAVSSGCVVYSNVSPEKHPIHTTTVEKKKDTEKKKTKKKETIPEFTLTEQQREAIQAAAEKACRKKMKTIPKKLENDSVCEVKRFVQTGKNEYHFFAEVVPEKEKEWRRGLLDITAHKDDAGEAGDFKFDDVNYKKTTFDLIEISMESSMMDIPRASYDAGDVNINNFTGTYTVDELSNKASIIYTNYYIGGIESYTEDLQPEDVLSEEGEYEASILDAGEYQKICKDTLGRTKEISLDDENLTRRGDKLEFFANPVDTYIWPEKCWTIESMDGTVKTDSICQMAINEKTYKVTAYGHKDDKSITGVITDKVEIKE